MTLGAIALLGAVGFSACSSDENVVEDNPTFDGETVRTDFAFNIATPKTKMTAANTQQDGNFNGMEDMFLLPFKGVPAAGATTNNTINYGLGSLASGDITEAQSSRVYALSIPVGTDNFLFYATATKGTGTDSEKGKISKTIDATSVNDIKFNLESIATSLGSDATNLAAYLTAVAQAEDENSNKWSDAASLANAGGAFSSLASLYEKFTTIGSGEARSGSMESVQRLMLDLYKSAKKIDEEATDPDVKKVAQAIYTAITTGVSGISVTVDETGAADNWTLAINGPDANFPANLELPMGAAQLKYDNASRSFSYIESDDELIVTPGTTQVLSEPNVSLSKIVYPSELVYYCNSPLWASEVYKTAADYPITTGDWDQTPGTSPSGSEVLFSSDWNKEVVSSKTRAVAMRNNVNYGVALLQSTVKLAADAETTMEDNRNAIIGDANQTDIAGNAMQVTGILIGGQPHEVGWKMIQEGSDASVTFSDVIYDKDVQYGSALTTSQSDANYTMVFDNYTNKLTPTTEQPDVLFALEIKNGNQDFYGAKNMIPKNSTFYIVGKLELSTAVGTDIKTDYPNGYRIPYVKEGSATTLRKRVFIQDHTTVANITISKDALKGAYSTIPDLISTQVVFGLSVDLKWKQGLTFSPVI